jgi:CubicO group peptidase (beta-lactamase class C family)
LTFRHLFNHQSGIPTNQGNTYEALRTRIATPFPALPASYDYSNANFGLMRILLPRIGGSADLIETLNLWDTQFEGTTIPAGTYANSFEFYVQTKIFAPIGIAGNCGRNDAVDTRQYNFPHGDQPGYEEPSRLMSCGGFGWHLSSNELAKLMVNLRYTNTLLNSDSRKLMDTMFLGWSDPTQFGWSTGDFGLYHNHGGDWSHPAGQAHTCIMKFNIKVEVALVINSQRNFVRHQCTILRDAFDAAWIA